MMSEYFAPLARRAAFQEILDSWIGTNYLHMGEQKRGDAPDTGGVDCTKFIGLALVEAGILSQIRPREYYPKDWYVHGTEERVLDSFQYHIDHYLAAGLSIIRYDTEGEIPVPELLFGDVCTFIVNRRGLTNHTGFYVGGYPQAEMIHCLQKMGVRRSTMAQSWLSRMRYFYRLYEENA